MRGNKKISKWQIAGMVLVGVLAFAWGIYRSPSYPLGRNLHDARLQIEREVSGGATRDEVQRYVNENFEESRYDEKHRCLIARYTVYSGGKVTRVEGSMNSLFYFDSSDKLVQIKHKSNFERMPLQSPEEIAEYWEDSPTMVEARRVLEDSKRGDQAINKELAETAAALGRLIKIAPSTRVADDLRQVQETLRAATRPSGAKQE